MLFWHAIAIYLFFAPLSAQEPPFVYQQIENALVEQDWEELKNHITELKYSPRQSKMFINHVIQKVGHNLVQQEPVEKLITSYLTGKKQEQTSQKASSLLLEIFNNEKSFYRLIVETINHFPSSEQLNWRLENLLKSTSEKQEKQSLLLALEDLSPANKSKLARGGLGSAWSIFESNILDLSALRSGKRSTHPLSAKEILSRVLGVEKITGPGLTHLIHPSLRPRVEA